MTQQVTVRERIAEVLAGVPLDDLQYSADVLAEAGADHETLTDAIGGLLDAMVPLAVIVPGPLGFVLESVDGLVFRAIVGPIVRAAQHKKQRTRRLERRAALDTEPAPAPGELDGELAVDSSAEEAPRAMVVVRRPLRDMPRLAAALAVFRERRLAIVTADEVGEADHDLPEVPADELTPADGPDAAGGPDAGDGSPNGPENIATT